MTNDENSLPQTPAQRAFAQILGDGTNPDYDPTQRTQKPKYNLTFNFGSDANVKAGQSDAFGDGTIGEAVARTKDGYVIAARADIITSLGVRSLRLGAGAQGGDDGGGPCVEELLQVGLHRVAFLLGTAPASSGSRCGLSLGSACASRMVAARRASASPAEPIFDRWALPSA